MRRLPSGITGDGIVNPSLITKSGPTKRDATLFTLPSGGLTKKEEKANGPPSAGTVRKILAHSFPTDGAREDV